VTDPKNISIDEFTYVLPTDRMALFPLTKRDESKLLVYQNGIISQNIFKNVAGYIPESSLLIFNDTKVVNARLVFRNKETKNIEIFCLDPSEKDLESAFQKNCSVEWLCMVGNAKAWKDGILELNFTREGIPSSLKAEHVKRNSDIFTIRFSWNPEDLSFSEVLDAAGIIPLPPYIKRDAVEDDKITYQTIYAETNGSVAAPTAGLHFTKEVFQSLKNKNIDMQYVTLHVGSGTFKPVKSPKMSGHLMHSERFYVEKKVIENLLAKINGNVIAVGTTSLRTIESLYWFGVQLIENRAGNDVNISQWEPYEKKTGITAARSIEAVLDHLARNKTEYISGNTSIIIVPGYEFKIIKGLITNFHQPGSTLLLLIAAFLGKKWKKVYDYALNNRFRFLSYGDSSILFR
jgi:S-adenosylmethionine:tRNA ribosyltransferase-isomerase